MRGLWNRVELVVDVSDRVNMFSNVVDSERGDVAILL
jgi:hypothetical protein